jgi:hypothetical protein
MHGPTISVSNTQTLIHYFSVQLCGGSNDIGMHNRLGTNSRVPQQTGLYVCLGHKVGSQLAAQIDRKPRGSRGSGRNYGNDDMHGVREGGRDASQVRLLRGHRKIVRGLGFFEAPPRVGRVNNVRRLIRQRSEWPNDAIIALTLRMDHVPQAFDVARVRIQLTAVFQYNLADSWIDHGQYWTLSHDIV